MVSRSGGTNQCCNLFRLPTELDKCSRTNFERHRLSAQIVINYEHANSHGQVTYLGEWHTHPEDYPIPSGQDMKMIKEQFAQNKIHTEFLLLLIQGRKSLFAAFINKEGVIRGNHQLHKNF
jgi:integrative and conjugative element protein (TIGR02256 family)